MPAITILALTALPVPALAEAPADDPTGSAELISIDVTGTAANDRSERAVTSDDGDLVAFSSLATDLVTDEVTGWHVYLRDRSDGTTTLLDRAPDGSPANDGSVVWDMSADGRYVTFTSGADNLVAGDSNDEWDVFLLDRTTGELDLVSDDRSGRPSNGSSAYAFVSENGRYVTFESGASDLVERDTNDRVDVFLQTARAAARSSSVAHRTARSATAPRGQATSAPTAGTWCSTRRRRTSCPTTPTTGSTSSATTAPPGPTSSSR